jgi:predicted RNA-binding Zn-ribbon protein involved in translation (DUF1610 family)
MARHALTVQVVASGELLTVHVCPECGALVVDAEAHRRWHRTVER